MMTSLAVSVLLVWLMVSVPPGAASGGPVEAIARVSGESRDPFAPALNDAGEGREVNPLERFAVGELRLVAIVVGVDPPRALIEDPSGLGFIITPGSIVGAERGTVVSIDAGRVVLETSPRDPAKNRRIAMLTGQPAKSERP